MSPLDFYRGALGSMFGLAIGDALGMPVEFMERDTFDWVTDYAPNPHWDLEAGSWTDDTSMALCLAQSLIDCKGFDPKDQLTKYLNWYKTGYMGVNGKCFDIGNTTKMALENFEKTGDLISPLNGDNYSGNGSLMRLAPISIFYHRHPEEEILIKCAQSSKVTHSSGDCKAACRALGKILHQCLLGKGKPELCIDPAIKSMVRTGIKSDGYVINTLNAALWAFWKTDNFEDCIIHAVNLGDDSDTVGAVAGMIAGAYYGYDSIPRRWLYNLQQKDLIMDISTSLYGVAINH